VTGSGPWNNNDMLSVFVFGRKTRASDISLVSMRLRGFVDKAIFYQQNSTNNDRSPFGVAEGCTWSGGVTDRPRHRLDSVKTHGKVF